MYTSESYTSFKNFLQNIESIFEINDCYRTRGNDCFTELSEIKNTKIKINIATQNFLQDCRILARIYIFGGYSIFSPWCGALIMLYILLQISKFFDLT